MAEFPDLVENQSIGRAINESCLPDALESVAWKNRERYDLAPHGRVMFLGDRISPLFERPKVSE